MITAATDIRPEITGLITEGAVVVIVSNKVAVPDPEEFEAERFTEKLPETVGAPLINPVLASTLRPAGKPVAANVVGEFCAAIE